MAPHTCHRSTVYRRVGQEGLGKLVSQAGLGLNSPRFSIIV